MGLIGLIIRVQCTNIHAHYVGELTVMPMVYIGVENPRGFIMDRWHITIDVRAYAYSMGWERLICEYNGKKSIMRTYLNTIIVKQ